MLDLPVIASHHRLSLQELFALPDHAHLAEYVPAFVLASIDVDLASDMSIDDFRDLLPDAPLGHYLLMRRVLAERTKHLCPPRATRRWSVSVD
jgi:hypothetical protein